MSTADGARRRNRAETTAAIESAAVALVNERGYDAVTVDMICERAGISQRTFFNHFKTKDAAVIGTDGPRVDQGRARRFIIERGPLLPSALSLIALPAVADDADRAARLRAVGSHPDLVARQLEQFGTIQSELAEILRLRLENESPDADPVDLADQAALVSHMLAGTFRYMAEAAAAPSPANPAEIGQRIGRLLRNLRPPLA